MDICKEFMLTGTCSNGDNCKMRHIGVSSASYDSENLSAIPQRQPFGTRNMTSSEEDPTPYPQSSPYSVYSNPLQHPNRYGQDQDPYYAVNPARIYNQYESQGFPDVQSAQRYDIYRNAQYQRFKYPSPDYDMARPGYYGRGDYPDMPYGPLNYRPRPSSQMYYPNAYGSMPNRFYGETMGQPNEYMDRMPSRMDNMSQVDLSPNNSALPPNVEPSSGTQPGPMDTNREADPTVSAASEETSNSAPLSEVLPSSTSLPEMNVQEPAAYRMPYPRDPYGEPSGPYRPPYPPSPYPRSPYYYSSYPMYDPAFRRSSYRGVYPPPMTADYGANPDRFFNNDNRYFGLRSDLDQQDPHAPYEPVFDTDPLKANGSTPLEANAVEKDISLQGSSAPEREKAPAQPLPKGTDNYTDNDPKQPGETVSAAPSEVLSSASDRQALYDSLPSSTPSYAAYNSQPSRAFSTVEKEPLSLHYSASSLDSYPHDQQPFSPSTSTPLTSSDPHPIRASPMPMTSSGTTQHYSGYQEQTPQRNQETSQDSQYMEGPGTPTVSDPEQPSAISPDKLSFVDNFYTDSIPLSGLSTLSLTRMKVSPSHTYPGSKLILTWTISENMVDASDWIGLFRDQQYEAEKFLTIRRINKTRFQRSIYNDAVMRTYSMTFHAPKSVGRYTFRYYRAGGLIPLIQSNTILVQMRGKYLDEALSFLHIKMDEDIQSTQGIRHLALILRYLTDLDNWKNIDKLIDIIREMLQRCFPQPPPVPGSNAYRQRNSLHGTSAYLIRTLMANSLIMSQINSETVGLLLNFMKRYCWLCEDFMESEEVLKEHLSREHSISKIYSSNDINTKITKRLSDELDYLYKKLYPGDDFVQQRQRYCRQLESWLCQIPSLKQYRLYIYGSSGNGFGNISCDVDLTFCYTYTDTSSTQPSTPVKEQSEPSKTTNTTEQTTPENKESTSAPKSPVDTASMTIADCCDEVVEVLQKHGMTNIDTSRLKARVPILRFDDPHHSLSIDLGLNNQLPVRNTQLLNVYANCDPRVRKLGLTIKKWAQFRNINDAANGSLSSYGYILMLIHFLQSGINPPLLPVLQELPPNWTGSSVANSLPLPRFPVKDIDGIYRDTYFYQPYDMTYLKQFAAKNKLSTGQLLSQFFYYYGYQFDTRHYVVSIRTGGDMSREDKVQSCAWSRHNRISIEDPFEVQYDIAHVLNDLTSRRIKEEMIRAYNILASASESYKENATIEPLIPILLEQPQYHRRSSSTASQVNQAVSSENVSSSEAAGDAPAQPQASKEEMQPTTSTTPANSASGSNGSVEATSISTPASVIQEDRENLENNDSEPEFEQYTSQIGF